MNKLDEWPYRWFGVWREYGLRYKECPSIHEFVVPEIVATYDKRRLRDYVANGQVVATTSRSSFPCPFTGIRHLGAICFRTDGEWLWLDDLSNYIDEFDVAIPTAWMRFIRESGFKLRPIDERTLMSLDWPPTA